MELYTTKVGSKAIDITKQGTNKRVLNGVVAQILNIVTKAIINRMPKLIITSFIAFFLFIKSELFICNKVFFLWFKLIIFTKNSRIKFIHFISRF